MIPGIEDLEFDRIIEHSPVPILVEFWQPGCSHCQALLQELEQVHTEVGDRLRIYTMNVQENFIIPGELEIHSLPALALYIDGTFEQFIGGLGKRDALLAQLQQWIGFTS